MRTYACNNYRKIHGLPMRKWVYLRKFDPNCEDVREYFHNISKRRKD